MLIFENVVQNPENLMGVKAVWGVSQEAVMCFSTRGRAEGVAERSLSQKFFVTIGAGSDVPSELDGRVLELVKVTGVYGETKAFVQDSILKSKLMQWPFAIVTSETYDITGHPHLINDLGFPDRRILTNAFDGVKRDDERILELWEKIKKHPIQHKTEILPPPGFLDTGKVEYFSTFYPRLKITSVEGEKVWKESLKVERSRELRRGVKEANKLQHGGILTCEGCGYSDPMDGMFDAHHLQPVSCGERESTLDDLVVLCPTCHRWVHVKGKDKLAPLPIPKLREIKGLPPI
ncbi:HNH endonuclease [Acetobacter tropicalis]|uniref:HNH endonuclease n=1 Tax=Acetobacter tropicalis TaxID=104102 RepID=UPI0039758208